MKTLIKIRNLLGMLALAAVVPSALLAQSKPIIYGNPTLDRSAAAPLVPCTDPAVSKVAESVLSGDAEYQAEQAGMLIKDGAVLVEVHATAQGLDTVLKLLAGFEGKAAALASDAPTMRRVWVRLEDLSALQALVSGVSGTELVAYRAPVANNYGLVNSEGISGMRTDIYEAAGLDGVGVQIAVIDVGFRGIDTSEAGPQFSDADLTLSQDASDHGTAMVEVIRDIAPASRIRTYRVDEDLDIYSATIRAMEDGANVIVCALSWFELPAQGLASDAARMATAKGRIWVNAAGNFADGAYYEAEGLGDIDIPDGKFLTFSGNDYMQHVSGWTDGQNIELHLSYEQHPQPALGSSDDAATANAMLALEVFSWDGISGTFVLVASGNPELEHQAVSFQTVGGNEYFPMIRVVADGNHGRLRMFSPDAPLYFRSAEGSLANPAAVAGVLSVGAASMSNYSESSNPESYSSQGGGIFNLTIDLCGPTDVTTETYGPQGFSGTSAAAAHVAGLMALQLQDPMLSKAPTQMLRFLDVDDAIAAGQGLVMAQVDDFEPDNDPSTRAVISSGSPISGHSFSPSKDVDWYNFSLAEDLSVDVLLSNKGMISIYRSDLTLVASSRGELHLAALAAGDYKLSLSRADADLSTESGIDSDYTVTLDTYQGAPDAVSDLTFNVQQMTDDTEATLAMTWTIPNGLGPISYDLVVAKDAGFEKVVQSFTIDEDFTTVPALDADSSLFVQIVAINEHGTSEPRVFSYIAPQPADELFDGGVLTGSGVNSDDAMAANQTMAVNHAMQAETNDDQAAGCAGTEADHGIALLLLALLGAAAALRFIRGNGRKEVVAEQ